MKVILLGDLHMGARRGDLDFANYFNKFFTETLYPYMEKNGIDTIIQAGDYFDDQVDLGLAAWKQCKPIWIEQLISKKYKMIVLVGNHDIQYKNTLKANSPELILSDFYPNIEVISKPTTKVLDGYNFDIVPWICKDNKEEIDSFIKKQNGSCLIGHFAIEGFPMFKGGTVDKTGLSPSYFENYPFVFSGHFHTRMEKNNISYIGVPYEITWSDFGDPKGFYVFDTQNQTYQFVENKETIFYKFEYQEGMILDESDVSGKIVKMIVKDRGNIKKYNIFVEQLKTLPTKDLDILEMDYDDSEIESKKLEEIDWVSNTTEYISEAVNNIQTDVDKTKIVTNMERLYQRALFL